MLCASPTAFPSSDLKSKRLNPRHSAPTDIYPLPLHDALPISEARAVAELRHAPHRIGRKVERDALRLPDRLRKLLEHERGNAHDVFGREVLEDDDVRKAVDELGAEVVGELFLQGVRDLRPRLSLLQLLP